MALNTSTSIVDFLKSTGQASDFNSRAKLASQMGITGYKGTSEQNIQMLNSLKGQQSPTTTPSITPAPVSSSSTDLQRQRLETAAARGNTRAQARLDEMGASEAPSVSPSTPTYFQRDPAKEQATIKKIGKTPETAQEIQLSAQATYTPQQLSQMSPADRKDLHLDEDLEQGKVFSPQGAAAMGLTPEQIAAIGPLGEAANFASLNLGATERPTNSALRVLQEALTAKRNVTNQPLGQSDLFAKAGIPTKGSLGYAALTQGLQQRSNEMQQNYNSFRAQVSDVSGSMADTYNLALDKYKVAMEAYESQKKDFQRVNEISVQFDQQMKLLERKAELDKEIYSHKSYIDETTSTTSDVLEKNIVAPEASGVFMGSSKNEYGVDFPGGPNSPITASHEGVVEFAGKNGGWGNQVRIKDKQGNIQQYSHLNSINVSKGQLVTKGSNIGGMGNTGTVLTKDKETGKWRTPTQEELLAGKGTHLDYSVLKPDGSYFSVEEAAVFSGATTATQAGGGIEAMFNQVNSYSRFTSTRDDNREIFRKYMQEGNVEGAEAYVKTLAKAMMGAGQREDLIGLSTAQVKTSEALDEIDNMKTNKLSYWNTVINENKKYVDLQKDQEWVSIHQKIEQAVAPIRKALLGTQIPPNEMDRARLQFPDKEDDVLTLTTKLKGLNKLAELIEKQTYSFYTGEKVDFLGELPAYGQYGPVQEGARGVSQPAQKMIEFYGATREEAIKALEEAGELVTENNINFLLSN